ncbi:hypothetical protein [Streptomyces sp. NPDC050121]|uniref:hypothetical protein n=1 Tax=Streptomyces sp. NPDC050121 TaxID=3365601 RepID=UPI0037A97837
MELLITVLVTIAATIVVGILAHLFAEFARWSRRKKRLGHLEEFLDESKHATVVLSASSRQLRALARFAETSFNGRPRNLRERFSSTKTQKSTPNSEKAHDAWEFFRKQPGNVLFGPAIEGAAVAHVYRALHDARKEFVGSIPRLARILRQRNEEALQIELSPGDEFNEDLAEAPFICIGGPSVNPVSRRLIKRYRPDFKIRYPEHKVFISGKRCCETEPGDDGLLLKDYGFILSGRTSRDIPFVVLWGVYAFGTLAAARALTDLSQEEMYRQREYRRLSSRSGIFLVTAARIDGYQLERDKVWPDYMNTPDAGY